MFKLLLKEDFTPRAANTFYHWLAPCLAVMPAIITIAVVPFGSTLFGVPMVIADVNVGIFFVFAILIVRRLRNRHRRLGVEFEISLPRRHSFQRANALGTSFRSDWRSFRFFSSLAVCGRRALCRTRSSMVGL